MKFGIADCLQMKSGLAKILISRVLGKADDDAVSFCDAHQMYTSGGRS